MATESKLWQAVNALGSIESRNEYERGSNEAISDALNLIGTHEDRAEYLRWLAAKQGYRLVRIPTPAADAAEQKAA